jgi:hypothetical protein
LLIADELFFILIYFLYLAMRYYAVKSGYMKKLLSLFTLFLFAGASVYLTSCSDDDESITNQPTDEPVVIPELKIEVKTITHNSMSFAYTTSNATACYALVRENAGLQFTEPSVVIDEGESLLEENTEGVYVVESLASNTRYDIDFVAVNGEELAHISLSLNTLVEPSAENVSEMGIVNL